MFTLVSHQLNFLLSYLVNEILGNNYETLVRSNSILEHRRTKQTENQFPIFVLEEYIICRKSKCEYIAPLRNVFNKLYKRVYVGQTPHIIFHLNVLSYYVAYQSTQKFASKSVNKNIKSRKDTFSINYNIKVHLLIAIVIFQ